MNTKYLDLLAEKYDTEEKVATELINLEAILNLPKGTEHFVSDLHGEYHAFQHVLRNGSGNVKGKIMDLFGDRLNNEEMSELATLVYYPEEKIRLLQAAMDDNQMNLWYATTIERLVQLTAFASTKYTRSKVRKALPQPFVYIIEELLYKTAEFANKKEYYSNIISRIISLHQAEKLIIGLAYTIQRLVVDHLHVVGDIYDRGPYPDRIIDTLLSYHSVDVQWGNHDVLWLGAFSGSMVCLANLIRICARYNNLDIIEDRYGINLIPLLNLAEKYYGDNPAFRPKLGSGEQLSDREQLQITKIHQAIAVIQFKLELPVIRRRPDFHMEHRRMLELVDYEEGTIMLRGKKYTLRHTCFTTVDPAHPERLLPEEEEVMNRLLYFFQHSERLARHMHFLIDKGSMYLRYNGNLLIHGCVPLNDDGSMKKMNMNGINYSGKQLLDLFEKYLRFSFAHPDVHDDPATDMVWYLWTGENSSLFGKKEMTTFERYFIDEQETHKEEKNPYYTLREYEAVCRRILAVFGLNPDEGHIINGHTPVAEINGETPIKADGKMIVIDGGFSKAYQPKTGIAGYTLLYNSHGMQLVAHQRFHSKEDVLKNGTDVLSVKRVVDRELKRKKVRETNVGRQILEQITLLSDLLRYRYQK